MAEMFSLTNGPMTVTGTTFQPITSMADVLAYDMLSIVARALAADNFTLWLFSSTQSEQDELGTNPAALTPGGSYINVLDGAANKVIDDASAPVTSVIHIGFGCEAGKFLRTLRWVTDGDGTFTIDVIGRRFG